MTGHAGSVDPQVRPVASPTDDTVSSVTYSDLARRTSRFAQVLRRLGTGPGGRVFTLLGRCPQLYTAVLGALKNNSVVCPLFPAFGPEPVRQRMSLGDARVLVTTEALYRKKVAPVRDRLPGLEHVRTPRRPDRHIAHGP